MMSAIGLLGKNENPESGRTAFRVFS